MHETDPVKLAVGKALGRIPSGVFVLACRGAETSAAMLVSWVQQAAFDPPAVCVAVGQEREIRPLLEMTGRFALSILGQTDSALLKRYARGMKPGVDPFDGVKLIETAGGQPVLADALAHLDCELLSVCRFGADHDLLIGRVTGGAVHREGSSFTHVRGSGLHY